MDLEVRRKLLSNLAQSDTADAQAALTEEIERTARVLRDDSDYARLDDSLAILRAVGFRDSDVAVAALSVFIDTIEQRKLTYSEDATTVAMLKEYRTPETLLDRALETLVVFRYLKTPDVLHTLLRHSNHAVERIRKKVFSGLDVLAKYDLNVFYDGDKHRGIGALPQQRILDELDRLDNNAVRTYHAAILALLEQLVSPEMEGEDWSYRALKLTRAKTPAEAGIPEIRERSIAWLKRLYFLADEVKRQLSVISILTEATRTGVGGLDKEARTMFIRDAKNVLAFFAERVIADDLEVVQKIEHNAYWRYVHAMDPEVEQAALQVESAIARNAEYQIFRTLVGFDGIFGEWQENKAHHANYSETDTLRRRIATEYVARITENTYAEWRARILRYAQVESDDLAMFPVFYFFLERFAADKPELALRLIREDSEPLKRFLIPPFRGLWAGNCREEFRVQLETWISEGRYLYPAAKQFLSNPALDLALLQQILQKAAELRDMWAVREMISVAVSNYADDRPYLINELMLPALEVLTKYGDSGWIFDAWFRKELESIVDALDDEGANILLANLSVLNTIDHHAERILTVLARKRPQAVLDFLLARLHAEARAESSDDARFEPLPFELPELRKPLSAIPGAAVRALREQYDGNYGRFIHSGARLLKILFPTFPVELEAELLQLVRRAGDKDLTFVLAVLRNYDGLLAIHSVCKEIIKVIPGDSELLSDVAVALESTGVVSGEYGMAETYERKMEELQEWLNDPHDKVQKFAQGYLNDLRAMSAEERRRVEERIALGKHKYGE